MTRPSNKSCEPARPYEPKALYPPSPRELIVIARPEARLRVTDKGIVTAAPPFDVSFLNALLEKPGRRLRPLFRPARKSPPHKDHARPATDDAAQPDLSIYFRLLAPDEELDRLAQQLRGQLVVDAAYVKPGAVPPVWVTGITQEAGLPKLRRVSPATVGYSPVRSRGFLNLYSILRTILAFLRKILSTILPDQSANTLAQEYLDESPKGIGARAVWEKYQGADGASVNIIDIESGWNFSHEDLQVNMEGLAGGVSSSDFATRMHGTAVLGVIGGDRNGFGVTGICPGAVMQAVSTVEPGTMPDMPDELGVAGAIQLAADRLSPGDIILIELQQPGPRIGFSSLGDGSQLGYIPVEWWEDQFIAIQYATNNDIIVVEAGGNGNEDLDDPIYNNVPAMTGVQFSSTWQNPFRRGLADSGAIIVGAGAPPPGTHEASFNVDCSRLPFSNFGSMFDAQGWGEHVDTTGKPGAFLLGDGEEENTLYTQSFGGTSSAAAMVAGALGCIQGALKGAGRAPLTPALARTLLRRDDLGSPQQDGSNTVVGERIGSRPNLITMIAEVLQPPHPH